MKPSVRPVPFLALVFAMAFAIPAMTQEKTKPPATYSELPSEIPTKFKPVTDRFDHTRRKVMIPMRDGVKLHTVILIPRGAKKVPILLTRTPYSADKLTSHAGFREFMAKGNKGSYLRLHAYLDRSLHGM
jgi:predicted acyl esterase